MSQQNMVRKHIIFYGRVQGVGFRFHCKYKARDLGLTGWVENLYDGSVEMEVQGEDALINELLVYVRQQRFVDVQDMNIRIVPIVDGEYSFESGTGHL